MRLVQQLESSLIIFFVRGFCRPEEGMNLKNTFCMSFFADFQENSVIRLHTHTHHVIVSASGKTSQSFEIL